MPSNDGEVLLDYLVSPFAQHCRIALAKKKISCKLIQQDLFGAKSELLLRSNPVHKKLPVLLHDGRPICASLVSVQYIDEAFAGGLALLPTDPYTRAEARFWAAYSYKIYEAGTRLWKLKSDEDQARTHADMVDVDV